MLSMTLSHWLAVAAGGALGAMGRFAVTLWLQRAGGVTFPWPTLLVNSVGSFFMGLAFVLFTLKYLPLSPAWRSFVLVGVLGGLTTFSTFALESLQLIQQRELLVFLLYVVVSVGASLVFVSLGYVAGKLML